MKICIVGAGAIGGLLAVKFSRAGNEVSVVDKGQHLEAIRTSGLRVKMADGTLSIATDLRATEHIGTVGLPDLIVLAVKAHQISSVAPDLPRIFGPETSVLTLQNGLPWWYFQRCGGPLEGTKLQKLDPTGEIARHIPAERIVGCVAYPACALVNPGLVHHIEGNRFPVGELDGSLSDRATKVVQLFNSAGFKSMLLEDIRAEIWLKAWGALSFNPISSLTHATMVEICRFPETRALVMNMMAEAQAIAEKLGIIFRHSIEKRIAGAEAVGAHKTSMLQDIQAGRALETEALIGAIAELGQLTGTPSPSIDAVYACTSLLDRTMQRSGLALRSVPYV